MDDVTPAAPLVDAVFAYKAWHGAVRRVPVTKCPDVEAARLGLEAMLETDVAVMTR